MNNNLPAPKDPIAAAVHADRLRLRSEHSRRQYIANLRRFEEWRNGRPYTKGLITGYLSYLQDSGLSAATINQKLASIKWWIRQVIDRAYEELHPDDADLLARNAARIMNVEGVKDSDKATSAAKTKGRGRHILGSELVALIDACDDGTLVGARDAAILYTAWTTGLRRDNLGHIFMEDVEFLETTLEDGSLNHYAKITLFGLGKGEKTPEVFAFNEAFRAIRRWLDERQATVRKTEQEEDEPEYLFCPITKDGHALPMRGLSGEALRKILLQREQQADIPHLTWHDFRHTFIGNMLDITDLATVQALATHASPNTTASYDRRPERRRRQAVQNLVIPSA